MENADNALFSTLQSALSQDHSVMKPAEQQLKKWEAQPGFYTALLNIFTDQTVIVNVRWLAVLCFKNGIDRYWRKNAPNGISEEEKIILRQRLITDFSEPVSQIATQLSVLIAKIARLDCPRHWDALIPALLEVIRSNTPLLQQRALLTLHHVIKALASKRLASDRRLFEELTSNIFTFILVLWNSHTENFLQSLETTNVQQTTLYLDHAMLCLKVLRRLVVFGFKDPGGNSDVTSFIQLVFDRIDIFLKTKQQMQINAHQLLMKREKILILLTKVIIDFQEYHAVVFGHFIDKALHMTTRYNFTDEGKDLLFGRFTVNVFNIMRFIVRYEKYKIPKDGNEKPELSHAIKQKSEFFTDSTLCEICRRLVLHYFQLTRDDLELWDTDPEDFVCEEGGDSWKYSLRPCTENLYLCLMKEFREKLAPVVVALVHENQTPVNADDLQAVLTKDAVYSAAGHASFDLYDDVDFDQWMTSSLLAELQNKHANYRIIRRRVIWLIGCWCGVKLSHSLRPTLYSIVLPLLSADEDLVVRIEAASTLKSAVDDFDFRVDEFLPFLEPSFDGLFQLLKYVNECETKMQILHVMSFIIERMKFKVRPYAGAFIRYLPALWDESADHNMLRCAILTTLNNLVLGLGKLCAEMYSFLLPILQLSTDVTQEPHVYLYEDGLDLWHMTLLNAPALTPELLRLYTNMPALLDLGGEMLQVCLRIIESYLMLGPREFLSTYANSLERSLTSLLTDLRNEGIVKVYKVLELAMRVIPEGPTLFSAMFAPVCKDLLHEHEFPMVVSIKMLVIARLMLQNQQLFLKLIDALAQEGGTSSADVLGQLLETVFNKMDNVIYPERKKVICLALCSLWTCGQAIVLDKFPGMLNVCVETLHDVIITEHDDPQDRSLIGTEKDLLCISSDEAADLAPEEETEQDRRKKALNQLDPVVSMSLKNSIFTQLNTLKSQLGAETFQRLMESADSEIVEQLQAFAT